MSLITFSVIGKDKSPLYLRDFDHASLYEQHLEGDDDDEEEDPFGFCEHKKNLNESSSLKNQFIIHSALDQFEELDGSFQERQSRGPNAMWIGLLGSFDETKVYGYMTRTKIKMFASIEDVYDGNELVREAGLKALFAEAHEHYVEYTLNPFSHIRAQNKISSPRFDKALQGIVADFNENFGKKGMSWM